MKKKNEDGEINFPAIRLQSYINQNCMVLAQKQKYRPMEQYRKPRDNLMYIWHLIFHKYAKIHNEEKTVSSISGAGKTGKQHVKEWK